MENASSFIDVAKDFSTTPGGRLRRHGPFSGEEFRTRLLAPAVREALLNNSSVVVRLDGTAGYAGSFLEEAFGGLLRSDGFTLKDLNRVLQIQTEAVRYQAFADLARKYMKAAALKVL